MKVITFAITGSVEDVPMEKMKEDLMGVFTFPGRTLRIAQETEDFIHLSFGVLSKKAEDKGEETTQVPQEPATQMPFMGKRSKEHGSDDNQWPDE